MWLNQRLTKSEPREAACTAFIENLGGVRMRSAWACADAPLLGGFKWLPCGPPFALHWAGGWKHNGGIQVLWDLTTVTRQPGETAASALKPSHSSPDYVRATSPAVLFLTNMNTICKRLCSSSLNWTLKYNDTKYAGAASKITAYIKIFDDYWLHERIGYK